MSRIRFSKEEWRRFRRNERLLGLPSRSAVYQSRSPLYRKLICVCGGKKAYSDICRENCLHYGHSHRVVARPCDKCGAFIDQIQHFVEGSDHTPRLGWTATAHARVCKFCREKEAVA